jgi:DMSO/TMAO reductase YedYZ heme-binding membrane subunit
VIHYLWLVKADIRKPLQYGFVLGVLLTYRIVAWTLPKIRAKKTAAFSPQT